MKKILGALVCALTLFGASVQAEAAAIDINYDITSSSIVSFGDEVKQAGSSLIWGRGNNMVPVTQTVGNDGTITEITPEASVKTDALASVRLTDGFSTLASSGTASIANLAFDITFSTADGSESTSIPLVLELSASYDSVSGIERLHYGFYTYEDSQLISIDDKSIELFTVDGKKYSLDVDLNLFERSTGEYLTGEKIEGDDFPGIATNDNTTYNMNFEFTITSTNTPAPTPEPATMLLMGLGLAGLGFVARRRK